MLLISGYRFLWTCWKRSTSCSAPWQRMDVSMVLPIMHNLPSTVNPKNQARDPDTLRDEEAYWQVKYPHRQND